MTYGIEGKEDNYPLTTIVVAFLIVLPTAMLGSCYHSFDEEYTATMVATNGVNRHKLKAMRIECEKNLPRTQQCEVLFKPKELKK